MPPSGSNPMPAPFHPPPNPAQGQQPWAHPGTPAPALPVDRRPGIGLAAAALVLGMLGCVVPLLPVLPFDPTGVRGFIGLPFALAGLGLGISVCAGRRRGIGLAVVGLVFSGLAVALALVLLPQSL